MVDAEGAQVYVELPTSVTRHGAVPEKRSTMSTTNNRVAASAKMLIILIVAYSAAILRLHQLPLVDYVRVSCFVFPYLLLLFRFSSRFPLVDLSCSVIRNKS